MTEAEVTFYNYFRSSAAYRVRIALALKGQVPARIVDVDLRSGAQSGAQYRAQVPSGLVPALGFDRKVFAQSLALIEWLDSRYPAPRLVPAAPDQALAAREIALTIACDIHPLNNLRVLNYLSGPLGLSEEQKRGWYGHWVREGFATVEALIALRREGGPFCLGAEVSLADVCLVPQVYNARRFEVDLSAYPNICAVEAHCQTLAAFRKAAPDAGQIA